MIMDNENKKLSRNRRRIQRKKNFSNDMKLLLNKIKSEKKKKNLDKIRHLEILIVNIKYKENPKKIHNALKELNKIEVIDKNLHEIKK